MGDEPNNNSDRMVEDYLFGPIVRPTPTKASPRQQTEYGIKLADERKGTQPVLANPEGKLSIIDKANLATQLGLNIGEVDAGNEAELTDTIVHHVYRMMHDKNPAEKNSPKDLGQYIDAHTAGRILNGTGSINPILGGTNPNDVSDLLNLGPNKVIAPVGKVDTSKKKGK